MKPDEIKLRLSKYAGNLVDQIMPPSSNFLDNLKNSGAKYWIKQNVWRLDPILNAFVDSTGNIDIYDLSNHFLSTIFDKTGKFTLDLKGLVSGGMLDKIIPQKVVVFGRQDLFGLFGITEEEFKERFSDYVVGT